MSTSFIYGALQPYGACLIQEGDTDNFDGFSKFYSVDGSDEAELFIVPNGMLLVSLVNPGVGYGEEGAYAASHFLIRLKDQAPNAFWSLGMVRHEDLVRRSAIALSRVGQIIEAIGKYQLFICHQDYVAFIDKHHHDKNKDLFEEPFSILDYPPVSKYRCPR